MTHVGATMGDSAAGRCVFPGSQSLGTMGEEHQFKMHTVGFLGSMLDEGRMCGMGGMTCQWNERRRWQCEPVGDRGRRWQDGHGGVQAPPTAKAAAAAAAAAVPSPTEAAHPLAVVEAASASAGSVGEENHSIPPKKRAKQKSKTHSFLWKR